MRSSAKEWRNPLFESKEEGKEERGIQVFTRARVFIWLLEYKCRLECQNRGWQTVVQPGKLKFRVTVPSGLGKTKELLPLKKHAIGEQLEH